MKRRLGCLLLLQGMIVPAMAAYAADTENSPSLAPMPAPQAPTGTLPPATLHDIRGPVPLPDAPDLLFWLLIALAVVLVAALLFLYFRKRRTKEPLPPLPHEIALAELDRLRPLMNPAQAQLYADQLAEVLRRYLEARFHIPSTRRTTREFLLDLGKSLPGGNNLEPHHDRLRHCLEQCDLSKFAHYTPGEQNLESMEQAVRDFVLTTGQPRPEQGKG
jgi:hypothetical protein